MQLLEFTPLEIVTLPLEGDDDMATTKDRLDGIDSHLGRIDSRLERIDITLGLKPPAAKSAFANFREDLWQKIKTHKGTIISLTAIVIAVVGWFGSGLFKYYLDHRNGGFNASVNGLIDAKLTLPNAKLGELGERLARVEGKLDTLLALKSVALSGQYAKRGNVSLAMKVADDAKTYLLSAVTAKVPSPPQYFHDAVVTLDEAVVQSHGQTDLLRRLNAFRITLAQYRSGLEPVPDWTARIRQQKRGVMYINGIGGQLIGDEINGEGVTSGNDIQLGPKLGRLSENNRIVNGSQTLDGIHWRSTIFVGIHIRYKGGEVELTNVMFINCTFDFPPTERGARVANYAALLGPRLIIG
jgi:hypothetical protein